MKTFLLVLSLLISVPLSHANTTETIGLLDKAHANYVSGKYDDAKNIYLDLVKNGANSSGIFYNLGTCEAQLGNSITAYAYLRKAQTLAPYDGAIKHNINILIKNNDQLLKETEHDSGLINIIPTSQWLVILFLVFLIFSIVLVLKQVYFNTPLFTTIVYMLGVIVLTVLFPTSVSYYKNRLVKTAVIIVDQKLLSGPGDRFQEKIQIMPGSIVELKSYSDPEFQQVQLKDGSSGYIKKSALLIL